MDKNAKKIKDEKSRRSIAAKARGNNGAKGIPFEERVQRKRARDLAAGRTPSGEKVTPQAKAEVERLLIQAEGELEPGDEDLFGTDGKRCDFARYHEKIVAAYIELLHETGLIPPARAIAKRLNDQGFEISQETVSKHLKNFDYTRWRQRLAIACTVAAGRLSQKATQPGADYLDVKTLHEIAGLYKNQVELSGRVDYRTMKEKVNGASGESDAAEAARKLSTLLAGEA